MSLKAMWNYTTGTSGLPDASAHQVEAAPAANQKNRITGIQIRNGVNACTVTIMDGVTVIFSDSFQANERADHMFDGGPLQALGAVNVQGSAAGAIVNVQGYQQ